MGQVNKDFGDVGGVGAGRIFTESYDVKAEGEKAWKKEENQVKPSNGHQPRPMNRKG